MSYLALARKWRPRTFSQLVGQEHINKALINALNQQRLHHAYLFTGTRGVGKTSIARILAKALNCDQGISSEPCLVCSACTAIEQGRFIDLIEIDGASKTRVEDTRELLDNVQYAPAGGRFKIYLIDEVHMLSQHSFNALLKTLEEPPAHVKFILATTDPQKLPVTVLSRCLQFHLKHLSAETINQQLDLILKEEHVEYEAQALDIIAKAAQGSMRDALSILDQALASCDRELKTTDIKQILGYTQNDYAIKILESLAEQNAPALINLSQQIAVEGSHFQYVLDELLHYLHDLTVYQSIGDNNPLISPSEEIKNLAQQFSSEDLQLFYHIGLKGREDIHFAPTLTIGFNMTLLRMLTFRPAAEAVIPPLAFQQSVPRTKSQPVINEIKESLPHPSPVPEVISIEEPKIHAEEPDVSQRLEESLPENMEEPLNEPPKEEFISIETDNWASIIPRLQLTGFALTALDNAEFIDKDGKEITLRVSKGHESLFTPTTMLRIEAALSEYYQSPIKILLNSKEAVQSSPAQQKERATQQKQQHAEAALHSDPVFNQLKEEFSAELVKNSIVPLKDDL